MKTTSREGKSTAKQSTTKTISLEQIQRVQILFDVCDPLITRMLEASDEELNLRANVLNTAWEIGGRFFDDLPGEKEISSANGQKALRDGLTMIHELLTGVILIYRRTQNENLTGMVPFLELLATDVEAIIVEFEA